MERRYCAESFRNMKQLGMDGKSQRVEAAQERGSRRVEIFVADAVDAGRAHGASALPIPVGDDFFQRHAVARSAPGSDQDIGLQAQHFFGGNLTPRSAQKLTPGGLDQLRNPGLGRDQRLAPLLAENSGTR